MLTRAWCDRAGDPRRWRDSTRRGIRRWPDEGGAVMSTAMERISANGVELEFASAGSGEAVVFIHGGGVADSYLPMAVEAGLPAHSRGIRYRRPGKRGSTPIDGPVSGVEHAPDHPGA